ncbi:MAG: DNA methyltransferase [Selenomonas sp.]|nr:DNA methyltransferase [Selenomonas sp.]
MAAIDDLIAQVSDPVLRTRLRAETKKLKDNKPFGLVFERHLPECTLLYDVPVKENALVARNDDASDLWTVQRMDGKTALCQKYRGKEQETIPVRELTTATEFGTPIYPYLEPLDEVENAPESDLWHTVIEADNYHALQLLEYAYAGKVDCIYIDPPYNTGAKDWKYNNDYVDGQDHYRHSKWLSFMQRRLLLAKKLLNPEDSVLIVTIDEKEYLHLGMLLGELFPDARIQMISSVINPAGVNRGGFARTDEYIFIVMCGTCEPSPLPLSLDWRGKIKGGYKDKLRWNGLQRSGTAVLRSDRPKMFYPIFLDTKGSKIIEIGESIPLEVDRCSVQAPQNTIAIWPLFPDGREGRWRVGRDTLRELVQKRYVKIGKFRGENTSLTYLAKGEQEKVENGEFPVVGHANDGSIIVDETQYTARFIPGTQWWITSHDATQFGTKILNSMLKGRFSFPKSPYAIHDVIRFFVSEKKNALIVDFFAGSGTTMQAVNLLNTEDGGHRRCILVTNNEVSDDEAKSFSKRGIQPGNAEWNAHGIARYVTWPRTKCSILGQDVSGRPLEDDYLTSQTTEVEKSRTFYQISFLDASKIRDKKTQEQVLSLLRDKKGKQQLPKKLATGDGFIVSDDHTASILFDAQMAEDWLDALEGQDQIVDFYIVTPEAKTFRSIKKQVNELLGPVKETEMVKRPMAEGFPANANFFHLGFLDKNAVSRGTQLEKLLPVLWLKAGAIGKCPAQLAGDRFLLFPANKFAVLVDVRFSHDFQQAVQGGGYRTVYIVTDYEPEFRAIRQELGIPQAFQLYKDYLSNFAINKGRA